jgi:UDP-glucose 4-epimerase
MTLPATIGVTGSAGFIGSNLIHRLLDEGSSVVGVDDMSMGNLRNLEGCLDDPRLTLHEFDCRDQRRLRRAFAECDAIVHLAAMKIPRYGGALETLAINVDGSHVAADVALSLDVPLVLASTSDVYGNATPPFSEDDPIVLGPPGSRRWSYAASKYFDEHLALRMVEERGLNCTILRFFNAYGPRNHPTWWGGPLSVFFEDLLEGRLMELHGDGHQVRSFTYVDDTVDGVVRTLERPETSGEVINIGGDEPIEIVDLAARVQTAMGIAGPLRTKIVPLATIGGRYEDVFIRIPSTEKAKRLLGFEARVGLDDGLATTLAWHRQLREERVVGASAAA